MKIWRRYGSIGMCRIVLRWKSLIVFCIPINSSRINKETVRMRKIKKGTNMIRATSMIREISLTKMINLVNAVEAINRLKKKESVTGRKDWTVKKLKALKNRINKIR